MNTFAEHLADFIRRHPGWPAYYRRYVMYCRRRDRHIPTPETLHIYEVDVVDGVVEEKRVYVL